MKREELKDILLKIYNNKIMWNKYFNIDGKQIRYVSSRGEFRELKDNGVALVVALPIANSIIFTNLI